MDSEGRPNILYIFTDQQSARMMSCTGNPWVQTPGMDSIAERGMRFKRAYCSYPLCTPSRAGMFTGRFPHEVGVHRNGVPIDPAFRDLELGHVMSRAGYECAYGGKWHVPQIALPDNGEHGFRRICGFSDVQLADACIDFLKETHDSPFFLVASFDNPHNICEWGFRMPLPWGEIGEPPPADECPPLPDNHVHVEDEPAFISIRRHFVSEHMGMVPWDTPEEWRRLRWAYARICERVDREISRILDALDTCGLAGNTLVIFSSDHGDQDGAHQLAHKRVLYEESVRIPFLAAGPGVQKGAVNSENPVNNSTDFFATICDYAGAEMPDGLNGRSLKPILEGNAPGSWPEYAVSEVEDEKQYKNARARMVRSARFKYMAFERGRNREQLFDLESDPGEMKNIASNPDYADILQQHREYLRAWCIQTNDIFGGRHYPHPDVPFMIPGDVY